MSSSRLPLAPDPDKWIETRPKSQPVQRPLVDLKFRAHAGISTPPSSTQRKRAPPASNLSSSQTAATAKKRRTSVPDVTPTAQNRGILSYLTPPTTDDVKGKAKVKEPVERVQRPVRAARTSPLGRTPKLDAGDATSSKSKSVASPQRRPSSSRLTTTPPPPELQFTQVPDDVFERHKRLCGQDSARKRKVVSPWRGVWEPIDEEAEQRQREADRAERDRERAAAAAKRDEEKERRRLRLDVREDVSRGAVARVASSKARRVLGETRSLVHLSSEGSSERSSSPSIERPALGAKNPNTLRKYSSETTGWRETKSTAAKLAPFPIAPRRSPPRARQLSSSPVAITTPPKRKSPHHKVTPPKSTKSSTPRRYGEQQETLFVFPLPAPPKKPVFEPIKPKVDEWEAVDMEPETLMTWSLGGARRPAADPPSSAGPKPAAGLQFVPDDDDSSSVSLLSAFGALADAPRSHHLFLLKTSQSSWNRWRRPLTRVRSLPRARHYGATTTRPLTRAHRCDLSAKSLPLRRPSSRVRRRQSTSSPTLILLEDHHSRVWLSYPLQSLHRRSSHAASRRNTSRLGHQRSNGTASSLPPRRPHRHPSELPNRRRSWSAWPTRLVAEHSCSRASRSPRALHHHQCRRQRPVRRVRHVPLQLALPARHEKPVRRSPSSKRSGTSLPTQSPSQTLTPRSQTKRTWLSARALRSQPSRRGAPLPRGSHHAPPGSASSLCPRRRPTPRFARPASPSSGGARTRRWLATWLSSVLPGARRHPSARHRRPSAPLLPQPHPSGPRHDRAASRAVEIATRQPSPRARWRARTHQESVRVPASGGTGSARAMARASCHNMYH